MIFAQIPVGPMQNFVYLVGDEKTKEAAVIDAGWDIDKIIEHANNDKLKIKKIILTHSHFDHVQKVNELIGKTNADVYFHELEFHTVKKHIKNNSVKIIKIKNNDEIKIGKLKIEVVHTPGHTPGAVCLLFGNKLITGDTLFVGAIGRTDLPGGDAIQLFESLQKLRKLDDKIEIYPGHDYGETPFSTIGDEKKNNPYFVCKTKEEFLRLVGY
ncbi:MAG TPA: MBL fold metallo-hydrolase [Candidatus Nanoarchaeia archaeon]|nr:MBL fold metallo-hydrolase [Candidatus Nanoarchaeia archaeon]